MYGVYSLTDGSTAKSAIPNYTPYTLRLRLDMSDGTGSSGLAISLGRYNHSTVYATPETEYGAG
jgi:hypothetical protein